MASGNNEAVILSACRTAIGTYQGSLSNFTAPQIGAIVIREAMVRSGIDKDDIDEVIMGQVVQAGVGQAPGRQAAIHGGVPPGVPCMTINKVCGSGLKAVMLAAQSIRAGDQNLLVVGGMESMSGTPFILHGAKKGLRFGDQKLNDAMVLDGLWDSFNNFHMGSAAELTAKKSNITREDQDAYAASSHEKALAAIAGGKFKEEIVPVEIPQRKADPIIFDTDEGPRPGTTAEKLAKLRPAFQKDGTVTAGNSPGLNDGGCALVVASRDYAESHGHKPLARVIAYSAAGTEPELLFYAPIYAVRKLCDKMGVGIDHFDLIEANEAFAAQAIADGRELGWDWERVNVHGGAIALGHPIGASGARVLTTLIYALKDRGLKKGLATLCLGGGNAVALAIEMED
ncbi:MAG TPA: acetyl-CoA C-acetyltransferase [Acidobacteriota bacterium]|nr:acetyl-CoA C-acetyltransferase [Acidobacteriota bacterium]